MSESRGLTRRELIAGGLACPACGEGEAEAVIDIHCHPPIPAYHTEKWIVEHQRRHGMRMSMLLPINSAAGISISLFPKFTLGQGSAIRLTQKYRGEFLFFTTADPRSSDAVKYIEKHLRAGAAGIGEVKLPLECDSPKMERIYDVAREWGVPVLIHFQHGRFATGFERFHRVAARYPSVNFIGHAQTWWGNIDRLHRQEEMYPAGRVTPGGMTDILLSDFPNVYADLSATSGFRAIARDRDHWRQFVARHQNKLLFGSDCEHDGLEGPTCWSGRTLQLVRMLEPSTDVLRKILRLNAQQIWKDRLPDAV